MNISLIQMIGKVLDQAVTPLVFRKDEPCWGSTAPWIVAGQSLRAGRVTNIPWKSLKDNLLHTFM